MINFFILFFRSLIKINNNNDTWNLIYILFSGANDDLGGVKKLLAGNGAVEDNSFGLLCRCVVK